MRCWNCVGLMFVLLWGCGGGGGGAPDTGGEDAAGACLRTCDDGVFCNGVEFCSPSHPSADGDGCIDGAPPCTVGCNETTGSCDVSCDVPDADGDGFSAIACGGDDCDDTDADRYPGNEELCDTIDQDCDSSTLGPDSDGDGFVDTTCCNPTDAGEVCGADCDDTLAGVNPSAVDGCGGGDEDCDGTIDEEPDSTYYRDQDADTYGDDSDTLESCSLPPGYSARGGDCVDDPSAEPLAAQINPGHTEICDGLDNNCDMVIDNRVDSSGAPLACGCDTPGASRSCGSDVGTCTTGTQTCTSGTWTECSGVRPALERCDTARLDEDCDGDNNEDCACDGSDTQLCTHLAGLCGTTTRTCDGSGAWGDCAIEPDSRPELCDAGRVDEDCDGEDNEGCACDGAELENCGHLDGICQSGVRSCDGSGEWGSCSIAPTTEACDAARLDEDCDGASNEGCACTGTETRTVVYQDFCFGTQSCVGGAWGATTPNGTLVWLYRDYDGDSYRDPSTSRRRRACGTTEEGYVSASSSVDCEDHNRWVTTSCSLPLNGIASHGCPQSPTYKNTYVDCPNHYDLATYTWTRLSGGGHYSVTDDDYSGVRDNGYVRVRQWCNFLEATTIMVTGTCTAHAYP